ncbi:MAG: hypothetical protein ACTSU2_08030, partial [Promethearchaeota archaeon]
MSQVLNNHNSKNESQTPYCVWYYGGGVSNISRETYLSLIRRDLVILSNFIIKELENINSLASRLLFLREIAKIKDDATKNAKSFDEILQILKNIDEYYSSLNEKTLKEQLLKALDIDIDLGLISPQWVFSKKKEEYIFIRKFLNRNEYTDRLIQLSSIYDVNTSHLAMFLKENNELSTFYNENKSKDLKIEYNNDSVKDLQEKLDKRKEEIIKYIEDNFFKPFLEQLYKIIIENEKNEYQIIFTSLFRRANYLIELFKEWLKEEEKRAGNNNGEYLKKIEKSLTFLEESSIPDNIFDHFSLKNDKKYHFIIFDELIQHGHTIKRFIIHNLKVYRALIKKLTIISWLKSTIPEDKKYQNKAEKAIHKVFNNIDWLNIMPNSTKEERNIEEYRKDRSILYHYILIKDNILDPDHIIAVLNLLDKNQSLILNPNLTIESLLFESINDSPLIISSYDTTIGLNINNIKKYTFRLNPNNTKIKAVIEKYNKVIKKIDILKIRAYIDFNYYQSDNNRSF